MGEQDYENKKLVITKFSFFSQTLNWNFRLSANRAYFKKLFPTPIFRPVS